MPGGESGHLTGHAGRCCNCTMLYRHCTVACWACIALFCWEWDPLLDPRILSQPLLHHHSKRKTCFLSTNVDKCCHPDPQLGNHFCSMGACSALSVLGFSGVCIALYCAVCNVLYYTLLPMGCIGPAIREETTDCTGMTVLSWLF